MFFLFLSFRQTFWTQVVFVVADVERTRFLAEQQNKIRNALSFNQWQKPPKHLDSYEGRFN